MEKNVLEVFKERVLIFDGGMGTMLIAEGLPPGVPPEKWNLEHPEVVKKIHLAYYNAGSDIVQTNTFGGNRTKLESSGIDKEITKVNLEASRLVRDVCPEGKYTAGDIGPTGKFLPPMGNATESELEEVFSEQASLLSEGGLDLINIETMYDLREALCALRGAKRVTSLPVFVSLTYNHTPRGFFTMMGDEVAKAVKSLKDEGADVVGTNCTLGSKEMVELVKIIKQNTNLPVIAQPNAGKPRIVSGPKDPVGTATYQQKPKDFAEDIRRILEFGCNIVGGCCGTNPEFIKEIKDVVKKKETTDDTDFHEILKKK